MLQPQHSNAQAPLVRVHVDSHQQADLVWQMLLDQNHIDAAECHVDLIGQVWTWDRNIMSGVCEPSVQPSIP